MCGFAGFLVTAQNNSFESVLESMAAAITHRGPDDSGIWIDSDAGVGLTHRRLSIVDLSSTGHQPMRSVSSRYVIVFNGEIYNHLDLRRQLAETNALLADWRGHSDTETLLACVDAWGVETTLKRCIGMFAFALWDREDQCLFLSRDRLGEKPLYYGWQNGTFLFGSELKTLRAHPSFSGEIDRNALTLQMRHNYIPAPYSIYQNICKLTPGTFLRIPVDSKQFSVGELPVSTPYWSLSKVVNDGQHESFSGDDFEAVATLDELLRNSVQQQMVADVPLGAFLSGGIDSSAIVAFMQVQSTLPVKTFSVGFNEGSYNEAEHAKAVAQHLGTEHTELYVSPREAMEVIPRLPVLYDEPFSDSSQIPTFLVSQMTRQHVTVALSGDAGDELFGGYNRYFWANRIWRKISKIPMSLRRLTASGASALSPDMLNFLLGGFMRSLPGNLQVTHLSDKLHKLAEIIAASTPEDIYLRLVSHWKKPSEIVIGASEPATVLTDHTAWPVLPDFEHRMMYLDAMSYMPDDILVKVDRAAMSVSLETRVPFLDHRVVEFAWQLPLSMKIRNGQGKWILRQVLYKYVPKALIERPKMGFGVPIDFWLRGPLRDWAENLLDESRLRHEGYLNPSPIRQKWMEHISSKRNWQYYIWDVLMFQAWLESQ